MAKIKDVGALARALSVDCLEWRREAKGHYRSVCGRCEIQRDQFDRWVLGVDGWFRGRYGTLEDAKWMASEAKDFHDKHGVGQ